MYLPNLNILLFGIFLLLVSCGGSHQDFLRELDALKEEKKEVYPVVYALSTSLSTTTDLTAEEAIPLLL